jgi:hypothetical protein
VEFVFGYFVKNLRIKGFMKFIFLAKKFVTFANKKVGKRKTKRKTKYWANEINYLFRRSSHASHVCFLIGTHSHLASGCGFQYVMLATYNIIFWPIYSSIG